MIGYATCRSCGLEVNVADITGGLCPICARSRAQVLSGLQRRLDAARAAGYDDVAADLEAIIAEYERREGVRLKDVPRVSRWAV